MKTFFIRHSWLLFVFLSVLALVGPMSSGFSKVLCVLCVPTFMVMYKEELRALYRERTAERYYLYGILFFCLYVFVQVVVWSFLPDKYGYKPTYGAIEEFLFAYLLLSLMAWVMGVGLTQKMFERIMVSFGLCTVLGGVFLLWAYLDMSLLWKSPSAFFSNVLQCRFLDCGSEKFPSMTIFLKDYSFYPTFGSLLLIPLAIKREGVKRWLLILLSILNACFLVFTINRGTMLGFGVALVLMAVYFTRKLAWRKKMLAVLCIAAAMALVVAVLPQSIKVRFVEMVSESNAFFKEGHDSGSASIRLTIWKTLLSHTKEFWLFGEGPLYGTNRLRAYLSEAGYQHYIDCGYIYHNQYLAYFHHYGIIGLLFLPFLLFYPLYAMWRNRCFSVTLASIIIVFAIALMEDRYLGKAAVAALLFILYFSFFQVDKWRFLET